MDKVTLTAPERIYLQISDDPEHRNEEFSDAEVTWCSESVLECEVEYVRTDLAHPTSPDVVRDAHPGAWIAYKAAWNARSKDAEIKAIRDAFKNLASVIVDIGSGNYYKSHGIDVRVEPWLSLAVYANDVYEAIDAAMAAREGGEV